MKLILAVYMFVFGLVALGGLYLFVKGVRRITLASASAKWPKTQGEVVSSQLNREQTESVHSGDVSVMFSNQTVVKYSVNNQDYSTDVLAFGQTFGSSDKSEALVLGMRYPVGKSVAISYDPSNPMVAVIRPGVHTEAFWLPGAALALLLPSLACLWIGPKLVSFASSNAVMGFAAAFFGAVMFGLGLLALTAGYQRISHGAASEKWPKTGGKIVSSGAEGTDDTSDTAYYARFVYEYQVGSEKHFNNLRRFAEIEGGSREEAARLASQYKTGAHVTVSYLPSDPDISVLEPGNTAASLWLPGIGVVLVLFAVAVFKWVVPGVSQ